MKCDNQETTKTELINKYGKITFYKGIFNVKSRDYECKFEDGSTHLISLQKTSTFTVNPKEAKDFISIVNWEGYSDELPKCENGAYDLSEHEINFQFHLKDDNTCQPVLHKMPIKVARIRSRDGFELYLFDGVWRHQSYEETVDNFDDCTKEIYEKIISNCKGHKFSKDDYNFMWEGTYYCGCRMYVRVYH